MKPTGRWYKSNLANLTRYHYWTNGEQARFFIDKMPRAACGGWRYNIYGSGMHPTGCAAVVGGASTLAEAKAKVEAILPNYA